MEQHTSYAVVVDEEGRFLTVANLRYRVGQTLAEVTPMRDTIPADLISQAAPLRPTLTKKKSRSWLYSLAALAACLVLVFAAVTQGGLTAYASVYMTINPEVRIDVTREDVVVTVEGVNEDGAALVAGYSGRKKALDLVMDELVDRAIAMGFLSDGGRITLTFDAEDEEWVLSRGSHLSAHLDQRLTGLLSATIIVRDNTGLGDAPPADPPRRELVIPVRPEPDSDYGESDYGHPDYGDSGYGTSGSGSGSGASNYGGAGAAGDSGYTAPQWQQGDSAFGDEEGQTDYGLSDDPPPDDDSPYGDDNGGTTDGGNSNDSNYGDDTPVDDPIIDDSNDDSGYGDDNVDGNNDDDSNDDDGGNDDSDDDDDGGDDGDSPYGDGDGQV